VLEFIEAIFLGIVQGLTEFLPVSSSGHLLLGQYFLGLDQDRFGLPFDAAIHTGTVLGIVAFLFQDFFETQVRSPWVVVVNFVLVGALFIVGEAVGRKSRQASKLSFREAGMIGLAQAAALVPGISRSGATITLGLFLGLRRDEAARFSFLMSVPITAAAALLSLGEVASEGMSAYDALLFAAGSITSGVVGYLAIRFLLNYLAGHSLRAFAYYRFGVAAFVAALLVLL
jgi:undecaprenyl-diphosphatase